MMLDKERYPLAADWLRYAGSLHQAGQAVPHQLLAFIPTSNTRKVHSESASTQPTPAFILGILYYWVLTLQTKKQFSKTNYLIF